MSIKIYIDQGHNPGLINAGAQGNGLYEEQVTFQVGMSLAGLFSQNPNFIVKTSRKTPDEVIGYDQASSLRIRVDEANSWGANYFLSIHANANPNPSINGSEIYVYSQTSPAYRMAQIVLENIVEQTGTKNNSVRIQPAFYVLRKTRMPAMLIELAYLTNLSDAEKLKCEQFQFAYGIYVGVLEYLNL